MRKSACRKEVFTRGRRANTCPRFTVVEETFPAGFFFGLAGFAGLAPGSALPADLRWLAVFRVAVFLATVFFFPAFFFPAFFFPAAVRVLFVSAMWGA